MCQISKGSAGSFRSLPKSANLRVPAQCDIMLPSTTIITHHIFHIVCYSARNVYISPIKKLDVYYLFRRFLFADFGFENFVI